MIHPDSFTITSLKPTDYAVTKYLFQDTFLYSEFQSFVKAWNQRSPEASMGVWYHDALVAAAIVGRGRLNYIFVHSEFQDSGLGTRLLHAVLTNTPNLHLTPVNDPGVVSWYKRHGFHKTVERGDFTVYTRHTHNMRPR